MKEDRVKEIVSEYLSKRPNVENILTEKRIIDGSLQTDLMAETKEGVILYIIEAKGSKDLNVIAGGLGQAFQYNFQKQKIDEMKNAAVIFACPKDRTAILDNFGIPNDVEVWLVEEPDKVFPYKQSSTTEFQSTIQLPGTFFVEGMRIELIEKSILVIKKIGESKDNLSRDDIQNELSLEFPTLKKNTQKNILITLSALRIINHKNKLSPYGWQLYGYLLESREKFYKKMIEHFYPLIINVINALLEIAKQKNCPINGIICTQEEVADKIVEIYGEKVRFFEKQRVGAIFIILYELNIVKYEDGVYKILKLPHPHYLP